MPSPPDDSTDAGDEHADAPARLNAALEGRYRVVRELGQGGMATVYLAEDLKHDRKVALKVLRPELAAVVGSERFLAEIKVTAGLQHPNILALHDSGEADTLLFYVMPYVEGESLGDRLERERQLPVDEAVKIATAVANALDFAHGRGVVHRDIKPDNILFQSGEPVVGDFGIALAMSAGGGERLTETGLSVGTPYYMSPEQAMGEHVGRQSDVYSLGCVLYEMLVGDPPYTGGTAQAVLGQIISGKPVRTTEKRSAVPPNVDAAIRKALEKVPADRFAGAKDFARALADTGFRHGAPDESEREAGPRATLWKRLAFTFGAMAAVLAGIQGWTALRPAPDAPEPIQVHLDLTPRLDWTLGTPGQITFSDDGDFLVYAGDDAERDGLWLRRLRSLESTFINGTERGISPAISPDGSQIAFVVLEDAEVRIVPLAGGTARTLTDGAICCLDWGEDGFVYFTSSQFSIMRVPASGGTPEAVGENSGRFEFAPSLSSDGEVLLYGSAFRLEGAEMELRARRLATGEWETVMPFVALGRLLDSGQLVGVDGQSRLFVASFDPESLAAGPSITIAEDVLQSPAAQFAIGPSGSAVYGIGASTTRQFRPVWVDRSGAVEVVDPDWIVSPGSAVANPGFSLSPDGSRVAMGVSDGQGMDIYVKQLPAGPFSRLTSDPGAEFRPRWTRDGARVTYIWGDGTGIDASRFLARRADGIGEPGILATSSRGVLEGTLSPDGWRVLRLGNAMLGGDVDIGLFAPGEDTVSVAIASEFLETGIALSPDGRWLAHVSDETGRAEVYVRSFPDPTLFKEQVSTAGGVQPVWGRSGRELYFVNEDREMVAVEVTPGDALQVGDRTPLFTIPDDVLLLENDFYAMYDVDVDEQRFMMLQAIEGAEAGRLVLMLHWLDELKGQLGR